MCYRCSTTIPLLRQTGNACTSCRQPLEFSFVSFGEQLAEKLEINYTLHLLCFRASTSRGICVRGRNKVNLVPSAFRAKSEPIFIRASVARRSRDGTVKSHVIRVQNAI